MTRLAQSLRFSRITFLVENLQALFNNESMFHGEAAKVSFIDCNQFRCRFEESFRMNHRLGRIMGPGARIHVY
jgi:hypothetical protein